MNARDGFPPSALAERGPGGEGARRFRIPVLVALAAAIVYIGSLWNGFALDDVPIVLLNPLVQGGGDGVWRAFGEPYWPADFGGKMYRPLPVATYALDALLGGPAWFHAVNVLWHVAASVAVALLGRRLAGERAALAAGLLFAVHPVHVEAVANVVGRAELMAALFAVLCVYAALGGRHPLWSALALAAGLLSKENAVVAPALVAWAWLLGIERPERRRILVCAAGWVAVFVLYAALRWSVLHAYVRFDAVAPVFIGLDPVAIRLTAVAALADVARLLVLPVSLRVEYTPLERTAVHSVMDVRFLLGFVAVAAWAVLLLLAWRRGRKVEAFGLGWIALAYLPVANLVFPTGLLLGERTLYLPSVGLALTAGVLLAGVSRRALVPALALLTVLGGWRSAARVPVWRDDRSVTLSILEDSPESYRGPSRTGAMMQGARRPERALEAYRLAIAAHPFDGNVYVAAADAAFTLGRPAVADTMLELGNRICFRCSGALRIQAAAARQRGDSASADSLLARARRWDQP
jgi:hypothetical protein